MPKQNKSVLIIFKILFLKLFKTSRKTFRRKLLFIFIPMGFSQKKETLLTDSYVLQCRWNREGGGGEGSRRAIYHPLRFWLNHMQNLLHMPCIINWPPSPPDFQTFQRLCTVHTTLPQQCSHMLMFPCFEMSGTLS